MAFDEIHGIVGLGSHGAWLAEDMAQNREFDVVGFDLNPDASVEGVRNIRSLEELVAISNNILLVVPVAELVPTLKQISEADLNGKLVAELTGLAIEPGEALREGLPEGTSMWSGHILGGHPSNKNISGVNTVVTLEVGEEARSFTRLLRVMGSTIVRRTPEEADRAATLMSKGYFDSRAADMTEMFDDVDPDQLPPTAKLMVDVHEIDAKEKPPVFNAAMRNPFAQEAIEDDLRARLALYEETFGESFTFDDEN